jgi:tetratricopeptide (TPR) repeat protein
MRKALEYFTQALPILHKVGDRTDEANALENIGNAENELGDARGALRNEEAGLSLAKAVENPDVQGGIDVSLMKYFRGQNRPEVAILFGMDAVNCYQRMRKNISGLGKDVQASFAHSKSSTYRQLAELLVQTDRLGEAEQVLDLLKEQELKEVVRGAAPDSAAKLEPLKLTVVQKKAQNELAAPEKTAPAVTDLSMEYAALLAKPARTSGEDARAARRLEGAFCMGNWSQVRWLYRNDQPDVSCWCAGRGWWLSTR